jgi:CheY-like chemotaxis protein
MKTPPLKNHTVLWADDDLDDLLIMRETLERLDGEHHVVETCNGQEVLAYLDAISNPSDYPCLIILDINMPVLNGRDTLAAIRREAKYNDIPVVMFTTSSSERDQVFCNQLRAKLYTKPSTLSEYEKILAVLLTHCSDYKGVVPVLQRSR